MENRAVLIVHGFGGNENEILYLHNYLKEHSIHSFWLRLAGHAGKKESLSQIVYQDWLADVEGKIKELEKDYEKITCVGFSMGGLLSIQLSKRPSIDQLVLCNTPIYLYNIPVIFSDIGKAIFFKDKEKRNYYFGSVTETSFKACFQFLSLLTLTKRRLKKGLKQSLEENILILQNKRDETTYYKSANYILKAANQKARLKLYPRGTHQLFLSENRDQAVKDILTFIMESKTRKSQ